MITKKELKREISKLLDICLEQGALLEIYKASAEESGNTIKELRRELKRAKRNEPIFTSDKYELKELREKVKNWKKKLHITKHSARHIKRAMKNFKQRFANLI
ncbi:MAG: hypothetical protein Q4D20_10780 [Clostridia bacterium]|nr:hypothetical protein [Clostridia bacterium]